MARWKGLSPESPMRRAAKLENKRLRAAYNCMRLEDGRDPITQGDLRKRGLLRAAKRRSWEALLAQRAGKWQPPA